MLNTVVLMLFKLEDKKELHEKLKGPWSVLKGVLTDNIPRPT